MGKRGLVALVAAGVVAWAGAASAATISGTAAISNAGTIFGPEIGGLEQGQSYLFTITAPGPLLSAGGATIFKGDWIFFNPEGVHIWWEDNDFYISHPITLGPTADPKVWSGVFLTETNWITYRDDGSIWRMFYGEHSGLQTGGALDLAYAGQTVQWTLTAVPEPSTWAVMIAGFGMAGAALRRRRLGVRSQ